MKIIFAFLACVALTACSPDPTMGASGELSDARQVIEGGRFRVERVEVFADRLAYHDRRGIYVIRDKRTGREYIGVSGIGITEVGSHSQSCGKNCTTSVEDER